MFQFLLKSLHGLERGNWDQKREKGVEKKKREVHVYRMGCSKCCRRPSLMVGGVELGGSFDVLDDGKTRDSLNFG